MTTYERGVAVISGASSGIGLATAQRLAGEGYLVVAGARRVERLDRLAAEHGVVPVFLDVTDPASITALVDLVAGFDLPVNLLVNNAGVAVGAEPIATADPADWRRMYEVNVVGVLGLTQALLPSLVQAPHGHVVVIGSTVGHVAYETGGGYAASKHAVSALASTLRLELSGTPVRVTEIAPGMVRTEEFLMHRFRGDRARYDAVYQGVDKPLVAEDIADCVAWCATRPAHVDIDLLMVRPVAQAAQHKVHRVPVD
ncbi:MAG: SDR family NAD(P)-dependent oxidoreductase [Saccharothrix sp.]|nr:SDR family NAD(P)-dependent oxidoreductase [Saccharothrix sp.]